MWGRATLGASHPHNLPKQGGEVAIQVLTLRFWTSSQRLGPTLKKRTLYIAMACIGRSFVEGDGVAKCHPHNDRTTGCYDSRVVAASVLGGSSL